MANIVVETLMSFLCRQNTLSSCQSFIQNYPDLMEQLVYFFFLPTVLIIIFIAVVTRTALARLELKYDVLLGIAIYVFIVMSGWYPMFLWLSGFWYVLVIIIFGLIFLKKLFLGGSGGGRGGLPGAGGRGSISGAMNYSRTRAKKALTGSSKSTEEKAMAAAVKELEGIVNEIENPRGSGSDPASARREYNAVKAGFFKTVEIFEEKYGYAVAETITRKYKDKVDKLDDRIARAGYSEAA